MNKGEDEHGSFTQVWATLQFKTLLLLCGGFASRGAKDELVQGMNNLARSALVRVEMIRSPSTDGG